MMFCQFLKASGRCLGTNIFPATKSLSIFPTSQLGLRFVRSGSPNFPTRFLRKPQVTPGSSSQLVFAQDQTEVAEEEAEKSEEVISLVNSQIESNSYGRLFAVVMLGWHQHKLTVGDVLMVNHDVGAKQGEKIKLEKVLLVGSKDFTLLGRPLLPRDLFSVEATVVEKSLSQTKVLQKFRKRQNYLKHFFRREYQTTLRINHIEIVKRVNETQDRQGFEPPANTNPLSSFE